MGAPAITLGDKFYDVAIKGQNVWAVGYFGTVVESRDMGYTWERQPAGTQAALLGVSFLSETHGWVVGNEATILQNKRWRFHLDGSEESGGSRKTA